MGAVVPTQSNAVPGRKPADPLPADLFERLKRNRVLVVTVGATGLIVGLALIIVAAIAAAHPEVPAAETGALYVFAMGTFFLTPSIHLIRYGTSIRRAAQSLDQRGLIAALHQQKRFWRFAAIWMLISVIIVASSVILRLAGQ